MTGSTQPLKLIYRRSRRVLVYVLALIASCFHFKGISFILLIPPSHLTANIMSQEIALRQVFGPALVNDPTATRECNSLFFSAHLFFMATPRFFTHLPGLFFSFS